MTTQQPAPQERRPANRGPKAAAHNRAALIAAAREIFAVQGLDAPLSAIARRAGVGQGVLYRHFPDREAIAAAVLEKNVREIEGAAAVEGTSLDTVLGVVTWHQTQSAAFIGLLHHGMNDRADIRAWSRKLSERVETALRNCLPADHRLSADDLMLAIAMVSGAATGPTPQERERRAVAAWRLLGITVGPVHPFEDE
ncbi:TetR/AcrR family transcriptional regulator [Nocardia flavorosea]|uniref:Helix-turn-helix transcriptional regulator n=1 Tax=Nocardia flavorosea TaxID=53429 RepID=A0A846YN78_9NOCA|nr:helix-turn-helix domain-containing protein [Nocardia flavorosea]NKY59181.1 helix-turn-helix transcriptional regulator [Nocardia flavorosea]